MEASLFSINYLIYFTFLSVSHILAINMENFNISKFSIMHDIGYLKGNLTIYTAYSSSVSWGQESKKEPFSQASYDLYNTHARWFKLLFDLLQTQFKSLMNGRKYVEETLSLKSAWLQLQFEFRTIVCMSLLQNVIEIWALNL
jgi:hypothetical protein